MKRIEIFKLVVVGGDENLTKEFDNVVTGLEKAEEKCKELLAKYINDYPDAYIACYDYDDDIKHPYGDYRCWRVDEDGYECWWWMKMGTYTRIGFYI